MKRFLAIALFLGSITGCSGSVTRHNLDYSKPSALGANLTYTYVCNPTSPDNVLPVTKAVVVSQCGDRYFKNAYADAPDDAARKVIRDGVIFELLTVIDDDYAVYEIEIRLNRSTKDTVVTIVSIGLTGAASLASQGAANTLAAIDTGLKGANAAVDTNFVRDKSTEILLNSMRGNRAEVRQRIYESMKKQITEYPLEAALNDLVQYYNEGSLTSALTKLAVDTAATAKDKEANALGANPAK